jgi:hypothetical protein
MAGVTMEIRVGYLINKKSEFLPLQQDFTLFSSVAIEMIYNLSREKQILDVHTWSR